MRLTKPARRSATAPTALAALVALAVLCSGCSREAAPGSSLEEPAQVKDDDAAASAAPGAPAYCGELTATRSLTTLDRALSDVVVPRTRDQGRAALVKASTDLDAIGLPGSLRASRAYVTAALRAAADGPVTRSEIATLAHSLQQFGQAVQSPCDFPVG